MAELEHMLEIDKPREAMPDDEHPTRPDLQPPECTACSGQKPKRFCKRCGGTGVEP
jgi:hypothetical protein